MLTSNVLKKLEDESSKAIIVTGPQDFAGTITNQGSKNATNRLIAATVAMPGKYRLDNFPILLDTLRVLRIVEFLGAKIDVNLENRIVTIDTNDIRNQKIPYSMTKTTTGAFGIAGSLYSRFGEIHIGKPGGDKIGPRPINLHVSALKSLGASVDEFDDHIEANQATLPQPVFELAMPSVGATVTYLLASLSSQQPLRLVRAPVDSDMQAVYAMLRQCGIHIEEVGKDIVIDPRYKISNPNISVQCPPDKNAAMTWVAFGAISQKGLRIKNVPFEFIDSGLKIYSQLGTVIYAEDGDLIVRRGNPSNAQIKIIASLETSAFHSDWLAPLHVVAAILGTPIKTIDTLFSQRVRQVEILQQMGSTIDIGGGKLENGLKVMWREPPETARYIVTTHPTNSVLHAINTNVGDDVRCVVAIILASISASGTSRLSDVAALYRGYENPIQNLKNLGVDIDVT